MSAVHYFSLFPAIFDKIVQNAAVLAVLSELVPGDPIDATVEKWDWLGAESTKSLQKTVASRCLSQFFNTQLCTPQPSPIPKR
jgi:hypothetical protein